MPKQLYKITQFHGGLNSNSDARDIAENELSEATDVMVDELGKIRMMGGTIAQGAANRANAITPGYGLFQFSHDRIDGHTAGSGAETGTDYLVFSDSDTTGVISIYELDQPLWGNPITGLTDNTSSTGQRKDVFYVVDGALRVCDSEFRNTHANKWYGYVDRTHFSGLTPGGSADAYDTWHLANAEIAAPTAGLVGPLYGTAIDNVSNTTTNLTDSSFFLADWDTQLDNALHIAVNKTEHLSLAISERDNASNVITQACDDWNEDVFAIYPAAGTGFNLHVPAGSLTGGTIPTGTYEFGSTFIYDAEPGDPAGKDQESVLFIMAGTATITFGEIWYGVQVLPTSPYDARITGGRIYTRIVNSGDDWQMIREISLKDGVTKDPVGGTTGYSVWSYQDSSGSVDATSIHLYNGQTQSELLPITYNVNAGISQDATSSTAKYKTAVVANRIAYIGNVQYDGTIYGDAVFKSPVNKFDTFSIDRRLEVSINDGDSIEKLEVYADRLLIFKRNKLELLNISQEIEFVEDTFILKGVSHPAATCKTDFGIAWVNKFGCYLYDGQKVNNLLEKGGRQIIKESEWFNFLTPAKDGSGTLMTPMIGYLSKKRQLIVFDDITNNSTANPRMYLYDMVTQSWTKGINDASNRVIDQVKTNFVTDWNGDLVYAHTSGTGTIVKWDDTADTSTAMVMSTKDIDFGNPGQKKTVYKVIVTYTTAASGSVDSNVQVDYGVDGDTTFAFDFTVPELPAANGWQVAELVPDVLSEASNIKSFRLRFATDGTVPAGFEINDVSIVYRLKGQR